MLGHTKTCWVLCQAMLSRIMPTSSKPSLAKIYHATQYWSEPDHAETWRAVPSHDNLCQVKLCQGCANSPHISLWKKHISLHGSGQCSLTQLPSVQYSLAWFSSTQLSTVQHSSAQFGHYTLSSLWSFGVCLAILILCSPKGGQSWSGWNCCYLPPDLDSPLSL